MASETFDLALNELMKLNKYLQNKERMLILAFLCNHRKAEFKSLRERFSINDGALHRHMSILEREKLVSTKKVFNGKKLRTIYAITERGRIELKRNINALDKAIKALNCFLNDH